MIWLEISLGLAAVVIALLVLKILAMKYTLRDLNDQLDEKLKNDSNVPLLSESGDATVRKFAAKLNRLLSESDKIKRSYIVGNRELRDSVTNISHDLRTPLTSAAGYVGLLKKCESNERAAEYLSVIEGRLNAMKKLTEELFAYSVVVSDTGKVETEPVNIADALEDSLTQFYTSFAERGIEPQIKIAPSPVVRNVSKDALSRIFGNVIGNAVRYSDGDFSVVLREDGGIVFSNAASRLDEVSVGKLFDRFFTVESGRGGTGLGLSIAKILTEKMSGKISARYEKGRLIISLSFPPIK